MGSIGERENTMTRIMIAGRAVLVSLALFAGAFATAEAAIADDRPNIILMIADDQGWDGLSVAMAPDVAASTVFHTPRLEALAAQGRRFSNAYAPAPVCSPSRISIQCGRTPAALHWTKAAPAETGHRMIEPRIIKSIPHELVTIGELMRAAGYATAHYGKWHIGGGGPGEHGYDDHDGDTGNEQAFAFTDPNPVDLFGMAKRTEDFMRRAGEAGKPFYVQLSWNALHAPGNALAKTKAKYAQLAADGGNGKRAEVAAITEDLDTAVGMVLDAVDRLGLAGTTYVIYTSDNGAGGGGQGFGGGGFDPSGFGDILSNLFGGGAGVVASPVTVAAIAAPVLRPAPIEDVPIEDTTNYEEGLPPLESLGVEDDAPPPMPVSGFAFPGVAAAVAKVAETGKSAFPGDPDFQAALEALPPGLREKLQSTLGAEFTSLRPVPAGKLRRLV